jgi:hypothetical protein
MYLTKQEEELVTKLRNSETYKECKKAYMAAREELRLFKETDAYKNMPDQFDEDHSLIEEFKPGYIKFTEALDSFNETRNKFYKSEKYGKFICSEDHPKVAEIRFSPWRIVGEVEYDLILNVPVNNISVVEKVEEIKNGK